MDVVDPDQVRKSLVQVRIGNQTYDAVYQANCGTCRHPARMEIEEQILLNHAYQTISKRFSGIEHTGADGHTQVLPKISSMQIRNHFQAGHMPLNAAALRALSERRAREIGAQYEETVERFVDHVTVAQTVVQMGHERLVTGEIQPDVKDTLAAAKLLKDIEDTTLGSVDAEAWSQAMMVYFETAQSLMPPDLWEQFTRKLSTNPILRGIAQKQQQKALVVDGEVVDA